ncbi:UDP-N-acetylmuramoylalanine--D-glutamate ligase MurD [Thalassoglobus polymorphus]|uniref:UDP-N-acetylmuramoylalanine--D-glutamate ligase n=2 Tax=Thalassoglobus polymorphus TaxID=2527994 RepID=A0A517QUC6_9PLAN|nr:UDP-N-acetylmuramoylalanine--D-glutamate ligase MurD [Thalassoglobus polymorphus]
MGLGRFGGGVGVVRFLLQRGAEVTLTDLQTREQLAESLSQVDIDQLSQLVLGEHREMDFANADLIVVNPGIAIHENRFTKVALDHNVPITTEMNLFWERCRARRLIVTGTVGKSTTTALIHHLLSTNGVSCRLGGNIGISLLPDVETISPDEWVVLELSSFQLEHLVALKPRAEVAVVTNFAPNHLDWHGGLDSYRTAKQRALSWQLPGDVSVLHESLRDWETHGDRVLFGAECSSGSASVSLQQDRFVINFGGNEQEILFRSLPVSLNSPHQRLNIAASVAAVCSRFPISLSKIQQSLNSFQQLPHRLEEVATVHGVKFLNDSKATTPEATLAALNSIDSPFVLIAGGKSKNVDLSSLCQAISNRAKAVALIGETGPCMAEMISQANRSVELIVVETLPEAFTWAVQRVGSEEAVLFSPACSSGSQFANYAQRGEVFRHLVESHVKNLPF